MALNAVRTSFNEHIATVTLNRPSSGNAVDESMAFALRDISAGIVSADGAALQTLPATAARF